jgi:hypothetical protein
MAEQAERPTASERARRLVVDFPKSSMGTNMEYAHPGSGQWMSDARDELQILANDLDSLAASFQAAERKNLLLVERLDLVRRWRDGHQKRAGKAGARLQEAEEALRLAGGLKIWHDIERDETDSIADTTGFDALDCKACLFNVARGKPDRRDPAKVAALVLTNGEAALDSLEKGKE